MSKLVRIAFCLLVAVLAAACDPDELTINTDGAARGGVETGSRKVSSDSRHVMIYYVAGYNDLRNYLADDIQDLLSCEYLPSPRRSDDVLLVFSKLAKSASDFTTPVQPVLYRVSAGAEGKALCDTLKRWDPSVLATDPATLREVLSYVKEQFPAEGYGLVFTSHATGYLPKGYYQNPVINASSGAFQTSSVEQTAYPKECSDGTPAVKSLGRDLTGSFVIQNEMEITSFADAIPYKLDYVLLDACLMGGIETAYALRGKCHLFGASQTEVLAEGFDYTTITQSLVTSSPNPRRVCIEYFDFYNGLTGTSRSATISLIDCDRLDALTGVCQTLFARYRSQIAALSASQVQQFGRYHDGRAHPWFFDLQDILIQAGINEQEKSQLQQALDACVVYKAATPWFFEGTPSGFQIRAHCGLSMFLPSAGGSSLSSWYKQHISWNSATKLVE